jgi:membrane-associated phospholipid phosphatase
VVTSPIVFRTGAVSLTVAIVLLSGAALADEPAPRVEWNESWRRFEWYNYIGTATLLGGAIGFGLSPFQDGGHEGGVLFDEAIRDAIVLDRGLGYQRVRTLGDMIYRGSILYPYLVDTLLAAWIVHDNGDVAYEMFMINTQSLAVAAFLTLSSEHLVGRARPDATDCLRSPGGAADPASCGGGDSFASFVSGHTAIAATSAGLICAHHQKLPLYGGGAPDVIACVAGFGAVATVATSRVMTNRHWPTDVLTGSAIGALAGYVLPAWLHYGFGDTRTAAGTVRWTVAPSADGRTYGAQWIGIF